MKIELSLFAAIATLFVLHTILTHLFNWWFRKSLGSIYGNSLAFCISFHVVEIVLLFKIIYNLLR